VDTYSKRKTVNGVEYFYCELKSKCNASITHGNGLWSQGRGNSWTATGYASHAADIDRVEGELMRGKSKEVAKENPTLPSIEIMKRTIFKGLSNCHTWIMDVTFRSCPKSYGKTGQVHTVHVLLQELDSEQRNHAEAFPVAYGLLPNKSKLKYFDFFTEIKKLGYLTTIIVDFEVGAIEALTKTFPKAQVRGCRFHLNQSILCSFWTSQNAASKVQRT
jgi:hypothetical protein